MLPKLSSTFLKILFYGSLAAIPLGIRHAQSGFYLYASDLIILLFLGVFFFELRGIFWQKPKFLAWFLFFALLSIFFALSYPIAIYNFLDLLLLVSAALATAKCLRVGLVSMAGAAWTLGLSAVVQSVIAFLQFWKQGSIGLGFFGEALISPNNIETAKVIVEGEKLIRASGTFPHANVLAAFLLLGLSALIFLWFVRRVLLDRMAIGAGISIILFGLLLTFSRTGWALAVLIILVALVYGLTRQTTRQSALRLSILIIVIFSMSGVLFGDYITSRAFVDSSEPAVTLRATYNQIGLEIVADHPLGVGIGNQVAFTRESGLYQKFGLTEDWQFQPIHNLYLLIAAEIGVLGLLAFLLFLIRVFFQSLRTLDLPAEAGLENRTSAMMLGALLLFGLTDHFLWTYQSGQLMLWLVIGIVIGVSARSITDNTSS